MAGKKRNKKEDFQVALNEFDDIKAKKQRELMDLNFKIRAKFKNQKQKLLSDTIKENRITFVTGSPGSGKTFIALKTGLELIKDQDSQIGDMLLTSPVIEVSPKSVGALPGTLDEKIMNYFQHFYDNIDKLVGNDVKKFLRQSDLITEKIVNFMRGTTFGKYQEDGTPIGTYCILDEAQNLEVNEIKTYLSRLGENSKMIILGDPGQCDLRLRHGEINGLEDAITRLEGLESIGFVHFTEDDIVRDPFLIKIMKRYID